MSGQRKNLGQPDEVIRDEHIETSIVRLGDLTVGRSVQQPGWRWTTEGARVLYPVGDFA